MSVLDPGRALSDALLALAERDGVLPLRTTLPGLYHRKVGERFEFWINPQALRLDVPERPGQSLFPGELYIEYQGWPFAVFDCASEQGWVAAGDVANMAAFIAALRTAAGQEASR